MPRLPRRAPRKRRRCGQVVVLGIDLSDHERPATFGRHLQTLGTKQAEAQGELFLHVDRGDDLRENQRLGSFLDATNSLGLSSTRVEEASSSCFEQERRRYLISTQAATG